MKNVLVCPVSTEDIITDFQLYGKRSEYELCIPKGDTHIWENRTVEFFGKKWRTFGIPQEWMEHRVPLPWNKRVKVERYGWRRNRIGQRRDSGITEISGNRKRL
ncbi:MAG: hypothetical protein ACLS4A_12825 [Oscillospiraceae bacterium]